MRISDWSSDVCSSDLSKKSPGVTASATLSITLFSTIIAPRRAASAAMLDGSFSPVIAACRYSGDSHEGGQQPCAPPRSEEHTSELPSLMRISYAVFCLKKQTQTHRTPTLNSQCTITYAAI